jgi:selenide,water dikinase
VEVLRGLPKFADPNALVGVETADDAAVYRIDDRTAIVETVDFFSPIVDDPYTFGQIAAANAISDIYAMGARPLFALNIAGFPAKKLPLSVLHEILRGGAEKAREAGIPILGGHTIDDIEPKYGMVVTGVVDPSKVTRNVGAQVGDFLVLTKPLGTGIVSNAAKKQQCPADASEAAILSMATLNRSAAEAAAEVGVHACTDVTGFGLVGHLRGMLLASGVSARVRADALPLLPHLAELIAAGDVPGGSKKNREFYAADLEIQGASEADIVAATDAQTSGGLLFSVAPDRRDTLLAALRSRLTPAAAVIGEIVAGRPGAVVLHRP